MADSANAVAEERPCRSEAISIFSVDDTQFEDADFDVEIRDNATEDSSLTNPSGGNEALGENAAQYNPTLPPLQETQASEILNEPLLRQPSTHHQHGCDLKLILFGVVLMTIVAIFTMPSYEGNRNTSGQPNPMKRFDRLQSCARLLSPGMECNKKHKAEVRCKALAWFQEGSGGSLVDLLDNSCSWDDEFGLLFALIIFRESLGIQDPSWHPDRPVHGLSDVCRWKRVTCGSNKAIVNLSLNHANLNGTLPNEMFRLKLQDLILFSNPSLSGSIPTQLGIMSSLERLEMHETSLSGTIPTELGHLNNLETLLLHETYVTGEMPEEVCSLTKLKNLEANCRGLSPMVRCSCCTKCEK